MKRVRRIAIGVLVGLIVALVGLWLYIRPAPNHNALTLGYGDATPWNVPIRQPEEFDGLTRDQIFEIRSTAVGYPDFTAHEYKPSDAVFGQIEDGLPWWGMDGLFYYGNGEQSIVGPSEESRFILNPYLLVGLDIWGWSVFNVPRFQWNTNRITPEMVAQNDFPPVCQAQELYWDIVNRKADVTYDVTACLAEINKWTVTPVTLEDGYFDIIAYNARDFNLNWIYIWYPTPDYPAVPMGDRPIKIPHFLHRGSSCQYPGDCNNMSPFVPQLDAYYLGSVPATVTAYLWKDEPDSRTSTPDMIFTIYLR